MTPAHRSFAAAVLAWALLLASCAATSSRGIAPTEALVSSQCAAFFAEVPARNAAMQDLLEATKRETLAETDPRAQELARRSADDVQWLARQVPRCGWPPEPMASQAAGTIAIHGGSDAATQASLLETIRASIATEPRLGQTYALLFDKIATVAGRPQRFGTQHVRGPEGLCLLPLEDPANVDRRRAALGLSPLADYQTELADAYGTPVVTCRAESTTSSP